MQKQFKLMALMAVLCMATGCTKEGDTDDMGITVAVATAHTVTYIVDGRQYYDNPQTDEEWNAFLDRMAALVDEGYAVQFWRSGLRMAATKEKVTYSTENLDDAKAWCKQKVAEGYTVTMVFNQATGKYDCIAYK